MLNGREGEGGGGGEREREKSRGGKEKARGGRREGGRKEVNDVFNPLNQRQQKLPQFPTALLEATS
jgi:hypothetical protein